MKLATFLTRDQNIHIGVLLPGEKKLVDLTASESSAVFGSMLSLIDGGPRALEAAKALVSKANVVHPLSGVTLQAPLPVPRRIRDFMCFEKHVRQSRANRYLFGFGTERLDPSSIELPRVWYERPIYYKANTFNVVGTEADVHWPPSSRVIDYELELAVITGKGGKNIKREDALSHVFGYTIFNDFSARDVQYLEMSANLGPAKSKDFDTGNVFGPWLVTADEIQDPQALVMVARINGEEWSRGHSNTMHHTVADMISYASQEETMVPGEILGTGTVGGGSGNEMGRYMKNGDVIELEISGIGVLRNRIVAPHVPTQPKLPIKVM